MQALLKNVNVELKSPIKKSDFVVKLFAVAAPIEFMDDYSKDSSIHGVKYFSERKRHWFEKYVNHDCKPVAQA